VRRWWKWWVQHPFVVFTTFRKPLVWTKRLKATVLCGLMFIPFPPFLVGVGGSLVSGVNVLYRGIVKRKIRHLLAQNPECTIIAITGSFGKTSVKDFLYTILDHCSYALTTPGSFNTYGGILRVLEQELTLNHRFFIAELGAYAPRDIADMAAIIQPDFGIITAVGPQHLERFGSQDAICQTKFELFDHVPEQKLLVNWDNELIRGYSKKYKLVSQLVRVSSDDTEAGYVILKKTFDRKGVHIAISQNGKETVFDAPYLFGTVMAENLSVAIAAALELSIPAEAIQKSMISIRSPLHRLEVKEMNQAKIIDNTYSSNFDGFTQVIDDLGRLPDLKVLVTPGVVELGKTEYEMHVDLGRRAAGVFDAVVLVGNTARTTGLQQGLMERGYRGKLEMIPADTTAYWQKIDALSKHYQWVLLENDVSEQYL